AAIANAKVTLVNEGTAQGRSAVSSASGEYVFNNVIPATYVVGVETQGFKKFERRNVIIETQQSITVDVKLEVGNVTESIQVNEEVALIETATASQGQMIDRQKMTDLPNLGRNPYMFSRLAPNVQQVGNPAYARMQDQSGSSQISIAGGPVRGNNYLLDGVPITDMANRAIIVASLEAVQEMKVQANTYDAEIGRTGGGMFNAFLKSGTNEWHGALAGYIRQTDWIANQFFSNRRGAPVTDQPFRNYMGHFGGRVWIPKVYDGKNKTFFFAVFEGYRDTQANSGVTQVPTAAERAGDFSRSLTRAGALRTIFDPLTTAADGTRQPFAGNIIPGNRLSPVGLAIARTFPTPNGTAAFHGDNNMSYDAKLPSVADQKTLKVDHRFFDAWQVNLSYLRYNSLEPGETWFPNTPSSPQQWRLDRKVDSTQINNTITVTPTTVLAIRYGFNRFPNYGFQLSQGFDPTTLGFNSGFVGAIPSRTFPNISFQNFYAGDAMGTNNNFLVIPYSRNLVGSISKYMGKHSIKIGADFRRISLDGADFGNSSGAFTFNDTFTRRSFGTGDGGTTGSDLASLLLGHPASATGFVPVNMRQYVNYAGAFFHDDIRVNSKLTLNLGVRWERETGLMERSNQLIVGFDRNAVNSLSRTSGVPTNGAVMFAGVNGASRMTGNPVMNKFSPRIGLAYALDRKTTIRAGYGIFWAPPVAFTNPYLPEGFTATTLPLTSPDNGATPNPATTLSNVFSTGFNRPAGSTLGDATGLGRAMSILDPAGRSPYVQQYSVDVQRELPFGIALAVAYVGSRSTSLTQTTGALNINQVEQRHFGLGLAALSAAVDNPYFGRGGTDGIGGARFSRAQALRPFPAFGNINYIFSDYGRARYDSLAIRAQKRLSQGLTFLYSLTWSKNLDNISGGAGNNLNGGNVAPQNPYDTAAEWGLSYLDSPVRHSLAYTYELPFGKGKKFFGSANRVMDLLVGGWSTNAVFVHNGGFPLMIRQNDNNNGVIFAASQRPNATGQAPFAGGELKDWVDGTGYLNRGAFSAAPALTFGNVSRSISTRGLAQVNWDMSLFKNFAITERFKAQFRAEALNAMNTPIFRAPNTAFGNAAFGRITAQANFARMYQLGLRLFF
ncbi:MAG: carboxypeptidase regulatory-like domain-containing protein, partial [Bryobacteraceae bacterium]|nr:carboxypeptidase regulatory-like domain-containing protein [Bryobacteraceae bacterium]